MIISVQGKGFSFEKYEILYVNDKFKENINSVQHMARCLVVWAEPPPLPSLKYTQVQV